MKRPVIPLEKITAVEPNEGGAGPATPFELLQEAPHGKSILRPGVTLAELNAFAQAQSDTEAALSTQRAKRQLLVRVAKRGA